MGKRKIQTLDDVYAALKNDFEWSDMASEDIAIACTNVIDETAEALRDAVAELEYLDAEFVVFANGSHGHLRVKRAIKLLRLEGEE